MGVDKCLGKMRLELLRGGKMRGVLKISLIDEQQRKLQANQGASISAAKSAGSPGCFASLSSCLGQCATRCSLMLGGNQGRKLLEAKAKEECNQGREFLEAKAKEKSV